MTSQAQAKAAASSAQQLPGASRLPPQKQQRAKKAELRELIVFGRFVLLLAGFGVAGLVYALGSGGGGPTDSGLAVNDLAGQQLYAWDDNGTHLDCYEWDKLTENQKCTCAKQNEESFIPYDEFQFCVMKGKALQVIGAILLVLVLAFYFSLIANTADEYLVPALERLSKLLKLSPNIAGVTLLAFGNGSPDLLTSFSSFSGDRSGAIGLGAIIGAGTFITLVVLAVVTLVKDFTIFRRPFLRDVLFYMVSVAWLIYIYHHNVVTPFLASMLLVWYLVYVVVVVVGRIAYQRFKAKRIADGRFPQLSRVNSARSLGSDGGLDAPLMDEASLLSDDLLQSEYKASEADGGFVIRTDLAEDEIPPTRVRGISELHAAGLIAPDAPEDFSSYNVHLRAIKEHTGTATHFLNIEDPSVTLPSGKNVWHLGVRKRKNSTQEFVQTFGGPTASVRFSDAGSSLGDSAADQHALEQAVLEHTPQAHHHRLDGGDYQPLDAAGDPAVGSAANPVNVVTDSRGGINADPEDAAGVHQHRVQDMLDLAAEQEAKAAVPPLTGWRRWLATVVMVFRGIMYVLEAPFTLGRTLTIPDLGDDCEDDISSTHNPTCLCLSLFFGPMLLAFVGGFPDWLTIIVAFGGSVAALVMFQRIGEFSERYDSHPNAAIGTVHYPRRFQLFFLFFAFSSAIVWVFFIANELVALLETLGRVVGLSESIMGFTVLALGNSMSDLFADYVLAKHGHQRMAAAGCIAGPNFNLLAGLGLGLLYKCLKVAPAKFELGHDPTVSVGLVMLLICLTVLLIAVPASKFTMTRPLGYLMMAMYGIFVVVEILTEAKVLPGIRL